MTKQSRTHDRVVEDLAGDECLRLIAPGGTGRIAFQGRFGPAVLPVNCRLHEEANRSGSPAAGLPAQRAGSRSARSTVITS